MATRTRAPKVQFTKGALEFCWDGCGELASKGKHYKPGHDAKLNSLLQKVADGEVEAKDVPAIVAARLKKNELRLPDARWQTVELRPVVKARVPVGVSAATVLEEYVAKRKGWSVNFTD